MKRDPLKTITRHEAEVLRVLLVEYRRARRAREQLSIIVDPWVCAIGATIFAGFSARGKTHEIEGDIRKAKR